MKKVLPSLFAATALLVPLTAQREEPTFEWQKRSLVLSYTAIPLGTHTLEELPPGQSWHMGTNEASRILLPMPALCGDTLVAPGEYRIDIHRTGVETCAMAIGGSELALGGGNEARLAGGLGKAKKPTKRLQLDWQKNGAAAGGNQPLKLNLHFGDVEWSGELLVYGNKTVKAGSYQLAVFAFAPGQLEARDKAPVPVATLSKGKDKDLEAWNLILGKTEARLVPWMVGPKSRADVAKGPDAARTTVGTVEAAALEPAPSAPIASLEVREATVGKGEVSVVLAIGTETLRVKVPEPKGKSGK
jgi:hypothetical protein